MKIKWHNIALIVIAAVFLSACMAQKEDNSKVEAVFENVSKAATEHNMEQWKTITKGMLKTEYGLNENQVEEMVAAEGDHEGEVFVGILATAGQASNVEEVFKDMAPQDNTLVYSKGDYVFYIRVNTLSKDALKSAVEEVMEKK